MKKIVSFLLAFAMMTSFGIAAFAAEPENSVTFNGEELQTVITNVSVDGLQPGDTTTIEIRTTNKSNKQTEWYVSNKIIKYLEEGAKQDGAGAYNYTLKYDGAVIYDSTVGGDARNDGEQRQGLKDVEKTLGEDYVHLGKLGPNRTKTLTLDITYDGKTIDNNYFNTQSKVNLDFAVEVDEVKTVITTNRVVTGAESNLWIYETLGIVAVTGILAILIISKKEKEEQN